MIQSDWLFSKYLEKSASFRTLGINQLGYPLGGSLLQGESETIRGATENCGDKNFELS